MKSQPTHQPELTAVLKIARSEVPVEILHAAGRELRIQGDLDVVLGARLRLTLQQEEEEAAEVVVEMLSCGKDGVYPARIHSAGLPGWLLRMLNTRNAFRVDADPEAPIRVVLRLGGRSYRGGLVDASQEGVAVLCDAPVEVISQLGSSGTLSMTLPEGRCQLTVQLRRLKALDRQCRVGMSLVDDGSLQHRRSVRFLSDYVMRRQREIARQHIPV